MSPNYLGMDPEAVDQLAAQLNNYAAEIRQLSQVLSSSLEHVAWTGSDRDAFVADWNSQHMSQLTAVVHALEAAARTANMNAADQRQTSAAGGASFA